MFSSRVPAQSAISDAMTLRIDSVFSTLYRVHAGCAVGVFQNGKIAMSKGYGLASVEFGAPITPRTPFIMGSVSKQFTAAAIALLVEQGRISLTDDIRKYVPELHDYGKRVTIDHLVHHTSGFATGGRSSMPRECGRRWLHVGRRARLAAKQRHLNFDPAPNTTTATRRLHPARDRREARQR
jgi:CubicO group peptidase (beta-lactamase class C family)